MTTVELYNIASVMGLILAAAIAAFVFPLWRRYRHRFLLVFGFSALLDIFVILVDFVSLGLSAPDYAAASKVVQGLHILSLVTFGFGLLLLVRFVRSARVTGPLSGGTPTI